MSVDLSVIEVCLEIVVVEEVYLPRAMGFVIDHLADKHSLLTEDTDRVSLEFMLGPFNRVAQGFLLRQYLLFWTKFW